nr:MAG TPA: Transcription initiation factor IIE, alpha FINGER, Transcription [Caudoviricetes sp.]
MKIEFEPLYYDYEKKSWICPYCKAEYHRKYENKPRPSYCMICKKEWSVAK